MAKRLTLALISAVTVFAWAPVASAQMMWSAAGATGAVDESDLSMYVFGSNGAVAIRSTVSRGTLNLRYPVWQMRGQLSSPDDCTELRANLRDTGAGARVIVRLMRLAIGGEAGVGELTTLAEIDSDASLAAPSNQYSTHGQCLTVEPGHLAEHNYYVDVQLIKTTSTANPGLLSLQICDAQDACDP